MYHPFAIHGYLDVLVDDLTQLESFEAMITGAKNALYDAQKCPTLGLTVHSTRATNVPRCCSSTYPKVRFSGKQIDLFREGICSW